MKKLFLVIGLLFCLKSNSHALQAPVWLSSNTTVNESTVTLCGQFVVNGASEALRGILHGVCVNTAAAGYLQVWGSTFTFNGATSITGTLTTATQQPCNFYDALSVGGLAVNKVGTADVSLLYTCY